MAVFVNISPVPWALGSLGLLKELSMVLKTSALTSCMCPPFTPFPFRATPGAGTETGIDNNINSWPQITKHLIFTQDILRKLSDFFFGTGRVVNSGSCRKQKGIGCISLSLCGVYSHFSRKGPERPPEPEGGVLPPWETSDKVHSCDLLYRASEQIWGLEVGAPAALSSSQFTTRAADLPMGVSLSPHPSPHFFHHLPTITNQAL